MSLLTGIINTRGHYARQEFYIIQLAIRVDSDLSSYDMIEWPEEQKYMRLTIRCEKRCHECNYSLEKVIVKPVVK